MKAKSRALDLPMLWLVMSTSGVRTGLVYLRVTDFYQAVTNMYLMPL